MSQPRNNVSDIQQVLQAKHAKLDLSEDGSDADKDADTKVPPPITIEGYVYKPREKPDKGKKLINPPNVRAFNAAQKQAYRLRKKKEKEEAEAKKKAAERRDEKYKQLYYESIGYSQGRRDSDQSQSERESQRSAVETQEEDDDPADIQMWISGPRPQLVYDKDVFSSTKGAWLRVHDISKKKCIEKGWIPLEKTPTPPPQKEERQAQEDSNIMGKVIIKDKHLSIQWSKEREKEQMLKRYKALKQHIKAEMKKLNSDTTTKITAQTEQKEVEKKADDDAEKPSLKKKRKEETSESDRPKKKKKTDSL